MRTTLAATALAAACLTLGLGACSGGNDAARPDSGTSAPGAPSSTLRSSSQGPEGSGTAPVPSPTTVSEPPVPSGAATQIVIGNMPFYPLEVKAADGRVAAPRIVSGGRGVFARGAGLRSVSVAGAQVDAVVAGVVDATVTHTVRIPRCEAGSCGQATLPAATDLVVVIPAGGTSIEQGMPVEVLTTK